MAIAERRFAEKPLRGDGLNLRVPAGFRRARVASHPSAPSPLSEGSHRPWKPPEDHRSIGALGRNVPFRTRRGGPRTPRAMPDSGAEWGILDRVGSVR